MWLHPSKLCLLCKRLVSKWRGATLTSVLESIICICIFNCAAGWSMSPKDTKEGFTPVHFIQRHQADVVEMCDNPLRV